MNKLYFSFFVFILGFFSAKAQLNYTFSAIDGTYIPLANPDTAVVVGDGSGFDVHNNGMANGIPIGFTFNYNGKKYNFINAHTDGFASFSTLLPIIDYYNYDYQTPDLEYGPYSDLGLSRPILAPLWDDNDLYSAKDIVYKTTGNTFNRVFTLQWNRVYWDKATTQLTMTFQILLFEKTNVVEFHYQQLPGALSRYVSAAIGISAIDTGRGNFLSLNNSSSSPVASSTSDPDTIRSKPANGQIYRFTPMTSLPVTLVTFLAERKNNSVLLNWSVANEQNNAGFEVQRSVDGRDFEKIGFVDSKSTGGVNSSFNQYSYLDPSLSTGNYSYRVKQVDKDEKFTYSSLVVVKIIIGNQLVLSNLYPNPVRANLSVVVTAPTNDQVNFVITDMSGKTLLQKIHPLQNGENIISINTTSLSSGNYMLKAISKSGVEIGIKPFVKN